MRPSRRQERSAATFMTSVSWMTPVFSSISATSPIPGVPASLIMAITMTLMKRASVQPGITPAGILRQVNKTLAEDNENIMFVTLFVGILDLKTGELAFSNAGHNPPLIFERRRRMQLPEAARWLGAGRDPRSGVPR